jgi:hypothetical protein
VIRCECPKAGTEQVQTQSVDHPLLRTLNTLSSLLKGMGTMIAIFRLTSPLFPLLMSSFGFPLALAVNWQLYGECTRVHM